MIKRWLLTVTSCSVDTDHWPGAETHVRSVSVISVLSCTMIQYQVSRVNNIIRSLAPGLQGHILWPDKLFDPDKRWSEMCWRREVSAGVCKPANILSSTLTLSLISEASQFILCQREISENVSIINHHLKEKYFNDPLSYSCPQSSDVTIQK